eukprot:symbB.v1.2.035873.t1/scaffold4932.1/size32722/3
MMCFKALLLIFGPFSRAEVSPSCPSAAPCMYQFSAPRDAGSFEAWATSADGSYVLGGVTVCQYDPLVNCCMQNGKPSEMPFTIPSPLRFATCAPKPSFSSSCLREFDLGPTGIDYKMLELPVSCDATSTTTTTTASTTTTTTTSTTTTTTALTTTTTTNTVIEWMPVTEWENQACRAHDGSVDNYVVADATTLELCQKRCVDMSPFCKGISYSANKCELWTHLEGIRETYGLQGSTCLQYLRAPVFTAIDGGVDRVCRGATASDNPPENYVVVQAASLAKCQEVCAMWQGCKGIEWNFYTRCEIWTRAQGIQAVKNVPGHMCMSYVGPTPQPAEQPVYP